MAEKFVSSRIVEMVILFSPNKKTKERTLL